MGSCGGRRYRRRRGQTSTSSRSWGGRGGPGGGRARAGGGVGRPPAWPPPAGSDVYELTELGRSLEPVVLALSRWGSRLVEEEPRDGDDVRPAWAAMALRSLFEPEAGCSLERYEFRIGGERGP